MDGFESKIKIIIFHNIVDIVEKYFHSTGIFSTIYFKCFFFFFFLKIYCEFFKS